MSEELISVSKDALHTLLKAVVGPAHFIRELQATMGKQEVFTDNPIDVLVSQFNDCAQRNAQTKNENQVDLDALAKGVVSDYFKDAHKLPMGTDAVPNFLESLIKTALLKARGEV